MLLLTACCIELPPKRNIFMLRFGGKTRLLRGVLCASQSKKAPKIAPKPHIIS